MSLAAKRNMNYLSFLTILLSIFINFSFANLTLNAQVDPALSKALQKGLDSLKELYKVHGISASVVFPNKEIWAGAAGMSDPNSNDTLKTDMLLSMGSTTKTYTCAAILKLASENKLSLDDPLYRWLPKFNYIDSTITIRQLLTHTSGIYNFTENVNYGNQIFANPSKRLSPEDVLSFIKDPLFKAGTKHSYSNTNYIILGMIIKKVTGSELSTVFHKKLLAPLHLNNTFLDGEDTIKAKIAVGWSDLQQVGKLMNLSPFSRIGYYSGAFSAGGMVATASDLAKWVRYLYGGEVLDKKYLALMIDFTSLSGRNYGMGTGRTMILEKEFWGHAGRVPGYTVYAGYCKQENISIAVMYNQDNVMPEPFASGLLSIILKYDVASVQR